MESENGTGLKKASKRGASLMNDVRMWHGWSFLGAFGCTRLFVFVGWMFGALFLAPANTQAHGTFTSDFE